MNQDRHLKVVYKHVHKREGLSRDIGFQLQFPSIDVGKAPIANRWKKINTQFVIGLFMQVTFVHRFILLSKMEVGRLI